MNLGPESETVEHKRSTGEHREACESIASILNRHRQGTIYFGVENDGAVIGQDVSDKTLRSFGEEVERKIKPTVRIDAKKLTTDDGRDYIRVAFEGFDGPYSCEDRYRIRVNDRDVMMTPDEIEAAFRERADRREPWDARPSDRPLLDVDEGTLRAFVERGRERGRIAFEYESVEGALASLGLLAADGRMLNAAEVLFCPSRTVQLKAGLFADAERTEVLDMWQERGTVFRLIDRAELFIVSNIRRRFTFDGSRTRGEVPEIPREAIREALLNAYAHRLWSDRTGYVQVDVYMDKVDIISPGWFIAGQDPEAHLGGASTSSATRNQLIASTLFRSGDIESSGLGMRKIARLCSAAGVQVGYERVPFGTRLTFLRPDPFAPKRGVGEDGKNVQPPQAAELPGHGDEVLTFLADKGPSTSSEVASGIGISTPQARRVLASLVRIGTVIRTGSSVATRYRLPDERQ